MTQSAKDDVTAASEQIENEEANTMGEGAGSPSSGATAPEAEAGADPAAASDAASAEASPADADAAATPTDAELVEQARVEAAEWKDKYLRLHAEWDTYRRRTNEQREAERARATEKLVEGLLPVLDDFERTIEYATNNGETGLLDGVKAVHTKLVGVLTKDGVEVIDPKGQAFDALEAQAVATVDDASVPDETVAEVFQKGYKMGAKVLRPAMVTVTMGGGPRPAPEAETE